MYICMYYSAKLPVQSLQWTGVDEQYGECQKCGLLQCRDKCKSNLAAHFTLKTPDGERLIFMHTTRQ